MSRFCCGVVELDRVIKSCESFGALIRCTVSNYEIGGILRDMAWNLQVTWSWRGRKDVFVFVVGKRRNRDWKTSVIVFVKAKETRSCCRNHTVILSLGSD